MNDLPNPFLNPLPVLAECVTTARPPRPDAPGNVRAVVNRFELDETAFMAAIQGTLPSDQVRAPCRIAQEDTRRSPFQALRELSELAGSTEFGAQRT